MNNIDDLAEVKHPKIVKNPFAFLFGFYNDIQKCLIDMHKQHGPVVRTGLSQKLSVTHLFGADAAQEVYINKDGAFSSEGGWTWVLERVFPGSVMAMDGQEHRFQRRIMNQAFKQKSLTRYIDHMNPYIAEGLGNWQENSKFLVAPHIKTLTLDLATRVFMGTEPDERADSINEAFIDMVEASIAAIRAPIPPFKMWKGVKGRDLLVKLYRELLPKKRNEDTPDFFSQFCHAVSEENEKFTDDEIVDHLAFLMMAAHDTTTSTLSTLFYALAKHPEWQERIRAEALAINKPYLDYDDLKNANAIELAMKEALRMYPPLPTMPRMTTKDTVVNGYLIPKDSIISVSAVHMHFMEEYWTDPFKFDPERFSADRAEHKSHPYAWIPFGGGAHMCIGQHFADLQVKAIMHQVVLNFSWSVPGDYVLPYQQVPIGKPKDGLPIKLKRLT